MKQFYVLSAIGRDRPGIVADVSELIYQSGCNLEDSSMTLLGDHFALLIMLSGEGDGLKEKLELGCRRLQWEKGLTVFISQLEGGMTTPSTKPEANYELRVVGLDRAGIVFRTSKLLASQNINITDLQTRIEPAPTTGSPVFTMIVEINVPPEVDRKDLRRQLEVLSEEIHVEISLTRLPKPQ